MANRPPYPDTGDDMGVEPNRELATGTPRPRTVVTTWQKVVGTIGLVVLLLVGSRIVGAAGGGHGPRGETPPALTEDGDQTPPAGNPHDPSNWGH